LDIGAGEGHLTAELRLLGRSLVAAETSAGCAWRLRRQGYMVWKEDVAETADARAAAGEGNFSLAAVCNVLDRCARPKQLLCGAKTLLGEGQWLLLATPLPFIPSFYGWRSRWSGRPLEFLGLSDVVNDGDNSNGAVADAAWVSHSQQLLEEVLPAHGFIVRAVSRVPYLSAGDAFEPCLELDDLVVLAQKV